MANALHKIITAENHPGQAASLATPYRPARGPWTETVTTRVCKPQGFGSSGSGGGGSSSDDKPTSTLGGTYCLNGKKVFISGTGKPTYSSIPC